MKLTRNQWMLAIAIILTVFAVSAAFGHPVTHFVPHDVLTGFGAAGTMPLMLGETSMVEVKKLIEDQGTAWEEFKKTNDERLAKMAKGEAVAELETKLAKINDTLNETGVQLKELSLKSTRPAIRSDAEEKAAVELKSFNAKMQAAAREAGKSFKELGADEYSQYKAAVTSYIRVGLDGMSDAEKKAINVGTASQGGYLVGEQMEATIDRVVGSYSAMRQIARVIPIGAATYKKLVKTSGTSGGTRGGERTATTEGGSPNWQELEFRPGTYLSEQRITLESLEDSVQDVEGDLMMEIGIEYAEMEGADFITGDGVNGARGILTYPVVANDAYSWGKLGYVASGGASGFAASNPSDALIDLQHGLKRQYRANAVWTMNDATLGSIRKFKDGNGLYLWAPSGLLQGAVGQLLGHPVVTDDFMPDLATNAYPIAFGDFKRGYYVVDRKGMSVLRDPYSNHPQVTFKARRRVGGGIANFEAMKLLKCATS